MRAQMGRKREKENMAEFIAKKRDMFLVQYSLDVKKQEMVKLKETVAKEEEALTRAEKQLQLDEAKFDQFLKDNDKQSAQAIKQAELQTKIKGEKVAAIKTLQTEISTLKSDISKNSDTLAELNQYKEFLDSLAPPAWLDEQQRKQQEAEAARARSESFTMGEHSIDVDHHSDDGSDGGEAVGEISSSGDGGDNSVVADEEVALH